MGSLRYSSRSGASLLAFTLKLRYCPVPSSVKKPTWSSHGPGHLADILTTGSENDGQVPLCAGDVLGGGGWVFLGLG